MEDSIISGSGMDPTMASVTDQILAFLELLPSKDLPAEVLAEGEYAFVDTMACMLLGLASPVTRVIAESPLHRTSGPISATLIGSGERRSLLDVALVHGVMAHVADFDDISWALMGHPSATIVAALLPLAEHLGSSGIALLRAYLASYEVAVELGHALEPGHYLRGWHATSTIGSVAVAAGGAQLLELDARRARNALGIAASLSSGIRQNFGSGVKSLHAGLAARNGLHAALLARDGFTADARALDGPWGFFQAFDGRTNVRLRDGAFSAYAILAPGTLRKLYPACGATHQAIDAAREIARMGDCRSAEIASVLVDVAPACLAPLRTDTPTSPLEAKFSMEFCVATALLEGDVRVHHFTDSYLANDAMRALMRRITVALGDEFAHIPENSNEASAARVTVGYRNGNQHSVVVLHPAGSPHHPLTPAHIHAKFLECATGILGAAKADASCKAIMALREQPSMNSIISHLSP